ncbi:MAG: hypothetical protein DMF86_22690 [Acidobacteria bacterium]|nr:MAG: hypothetical protein DMF86_22690 [Acidobacteriota bacterium]
MKLLRRALGWIRRRRLDADLAEELEFHRSAAQAALERDGLSADDARAASRRALGNLTLAREDARAVWIAPWIESVWQDARYAARTLRRERGSTLVALGALTVAIGLNTAVFSVFNAFVFRPWPVRDANRVVNVYNLSRLDLRKRAGGGPQGFSLAEVEYLGAHARTISDFVVLGRAGSGRLDDRDDEARLAWVGGTYFTALGVPIAYGRGFDAGDAGPDAPPVVVLSDPCWRLAFGGDPSIVGTTIRLDPAFVGTGMGRTDVWLPLTAARLLRPTDPWVRNVLGKPDNCCTPLAGRLAPGVTPEQAQAELLVLRRQFHPDRAPEEAAVDLRGTTLAADPRANLSSLFVPLFTGAALVLVIACANVAHLLLARGLARRREIGVRLSLGAGRGRIVRQLLTETLVLVTAAGALGVAIAAWLPLQVIERWAAGWTALRVAPDARVAAFAIAAGACAWALCGLVPALQTTRSSVVDAVRDTPPRDGLGVPPPRRASRRARPDRRWSGPRSGVTCSASAPWIPSRTSKRRWC